MGHASDPSVPERPGGPQFSRRLHEKRRMSKPGVWDKWTERGHQFCLRNRGFGTSVLKAPGRTKIWGFCNGDAGTHGLSLELRGPRGIGVVAVFRPRSTDELKSAV